jgi:hypothetical protein
VPGGYSLYNDLIGSAVVDFKKTLGFHTSMLQIMVFLIMGAMMGFATIVFRVE